MNCRTLRRVRFFHQHLGERRVGMDVAGDLGRGQLHYLRQSEFGQEFGHFGTDQCRAQNLAVFFSTTSLTQDMEKI